MSETTKTPRGNAVYRRFYNPREGRADANAMAEHIGRLETALAAAERLLALFGVAKCEACGGNGRSVEFCADFETPEQVQCQDCAGVGHIQKQTAAEQRAKALEADLGIIASSYDDALSQSELAMRMYDAACVARRALLKEAP